VPADPAALRAFYAFRDFPHFIEVYTAVSGLVRAAADIEALVVGLGGDLLAQGVLYAEVTVTPVTQLRVGIRAGDLARALESGAAQVRRDTGVELAWVYDISAGDGCSGARETLQVALDQPPAGLVGFGLGGARPVSTAPTTSSPETGHLTRRLGWSRSYEPTTTGCPAKP